MRFRSGTLVRADWSIFILRLYGSKSNQYKSKTGIVRNSLNWLSTNIGVVYSPGGTPYGSYHSVGLNVPDGPSVGILCVIRV